MRRRMNLLKRPSLKILNPKDTSFSSLPITSKITKKILVFRGLRRELENSALNPENHVTENHVRCFRKMNPNDPFMIIQDYPSSNILNDIRFLNWHFSIKNSQKNKKLRNCKDYADHISSTGIRFHLYAHVFQ